MTDAAGIWDVAGIVNGLAELRAADPDRRIFAASDHGYRLGPPVDAALLASVEHLVGAELPAGYREFITTVGDGAPGPYYGIKPLTEALESLDDSSGRAGLGADSPLTGDISFGEVMGQPAVWAEHVSRLGADATYASGWDRLREEHLQRPWTDGRLPVADYGCGDWFFLVVRGPRRGTMWVDSVDSATGLYCLEVDFLTWYGRWLHDSLSRASAGDFAPVNARYSYLRYGDNPRYQVARSTGPAAPTDR